MYDKDKRVNLINRRTVAWILEAFPVYLIGSLLTFATGVANLHFIVLAAYLLVRDLPATGSWGKKLVGLGVESDKAELGASAKVLRNVPLIIPIVPLVEFFVAYTDANGMRRLGDRFAGTRVVDLAPERFGDGSWTGQLVGALVVTGAIHYFVMQALLT